MANLPAELVYERYKQAIDKLLVPFDKFREAWEDLDDENRDWWLKEFETDPSGLVKFKEAMEMDLERPFDIDEFRKKYPEVVTAIEARVKELKPLGLAE